MKFAGKVGMPPKYEASDGGQTIVSGIREADYMRMPDVSHAFGVIFGDLYDWDQEFDKLYTAIGKTRKNEVGRQVRVLVPPEYESHSAEPQPFTLGGMGLGDAQLLKAAQEGEGIIQACTMPSAADKRTTRAVLCSG